MGGGVCGGGGLGGERGGDRVWVGVGFYKFNSEGPSQNLLSYPARATTKEDIRAKMTGGGGKIVRKGVTPNFVTSFRVGGKEVDTSGQNQERASPDSQLTTANPITGT